jgi:hypothetical protein
MNSYSTRFCSRLKFRRIVPNKCRLLNLRKTMFQKSQIREIFWELSLRVQCPEIQCVCLLRVDIQLASWCRNKMSLVLDRRLVNPGVNIPVLISVVFQHPQWTASRVCERLSWHSRIPYERHPLEPYSEDKVNHTIGMGVVEAFDDFHNDAVPIVRLIHIWCLALNPENVTLRPGDGRRARCGGDIRAAHDNDVRNMILGIIRRQTAIRFSIDVVAWSVWNSGLVRKVNSTDMKPGVPDNVFFTVSRALRLYLSNLPCGGSMGVPKVPGTKRTY